MQTLTIETEKKEVTKLLVEVPIPSYFMRQDGTKLVGILDEDTVIEIIDDGYEQVVNKFNNKAWNVGKDRVAFAYNNYHGCTESAFIEKYDAVIESISIHQKLAV